MKKRKILKRMTALMAVLFTAVQVSAQWQCPNCGSAQEDHFCSNCGSQNPDEAGAVQGGSERAVQLEKLSVDLRLDEDTYNIFEHNAMEQGQLSLKRLPLSEEQVTASLNDVLGEAWEVYVSPAGDEVFPGRFAWIITEYGVYDDMEAFRASENYETYKENGGWMETEENGVQYLFQDVWAQDQDSREAGNSLFEFQTIRNGCILHLYAYDSQDGSGEVEILPELFARIGEAFGSSGTASSQAEKKEEASGQMHGEAFPYSGELYFSHLNQASLLVNESRVTRELDRKSDTIEEYYCVDEKGMMAPIRLMENENGDFLEAEFEVVFPLTDMQEVNDEVVKFSNSMTYCVLASISAMGDDLYDEQILENFAAIMEDLWDEADQYVEHYSAGMEKKTMERTVAPYGKAVVSVNMNDDLEMYTICFRWLPVEAENVKEGKKNIADV